MHIIYVVYNWTTFRLNSGHHLGVYVDIIPASFNMEHVDNILVFMSITFLYQEETPHMYHEQTTYINRTMI
jgi:hypothetical protein